MKTHTLLQLLLLSLIAFDVSHVVSVRELGNSGDLDPKDNNKAKDPNPVGETNKEKGVSPSTNQGGGGPPVSPPQATPKMVENGKDGKEGVNNTVPPPVSLPPKPKNDDGVDKDQEQGKEKNGGKFSHSSTTDTCHGLKMCKDDGVMHACISKTDSKYLVVLLHNGGDGIIKVKLRTDFENNLGEVEVDKNQTEKVNITQSSSQSTQLTLNAGKGDCVLHMVTHIPDGNSFLRLPSYDKILTPVNGAYFLILMVLLFGGTWAFCACRKKRTDEVPYQELEMALPESVSATNVEAAEGWDQDWDDDWDDDVAVKSPATRTGSISANGLTSRSSNKDGWENSWDD